MTVSPRQAFGPATLTIKLQVTPQADNRLVRVTVDDGDNFFRSTDIDLEGEEARKTQAPIVYPRVPAGHYQVTAQLVDNHGKVIATVKQVVDLLGDQ